MSKHRKTWSQQENLTD